MLKQTVTEFTVATRGRGLHEVTHDVAAWVSHSGIRTGLITLHVRHTSASLLIQENADPDVQEDLDRFFARLAPDARRTGPDPLARPDRRSPGSAATPRCGAHGA